MVELKVDDIVFCTVEKVEGASVFVKIDGEKKQGAIVLSEVAAGRIRNLREYVSPGRKIVCKVLNLSRGNIELSLRRVTSKERDDVLDANKKERALMSILRIVGENAEKIISEIREKYNLVEFFDKLEEDSFILNEFLSKEKVAKVFSMLTEKDVAEKKVEKRFNLRTVSEKGVNDIKEILDFLNVEFHYLGSGVFSIAAKGKDFKTANVCLDDVLKEIENRAELKKAQFSLMKEKN